MRRHARLRMSPSPGGDRAANIRGKVSLVLDVGPARKVEVKIPGAWAINAAARAAIKAIPGVVDVHDV